MALFILYYGYVFSGLFQHLAKTITNATVSRNSREKSVSSSSALFAFPAPGECFVMYYGQIVSARGFENNEILLQYTVDLPTGLFSTECFPISRYHTYFTVILMNFEFGYSFVIFHYIPSVFMAVN